MADGPRLVEETITARWHQRFRLDTPVCLIIGMPDKVLLVNARLRDMSDDGGAVFAAVELAIDSELQLEYTPSFNRGPVRVRAVVRNRRGYIYGLEFLPRDGVEEQILLTLKAMLLSTGSLVDGRVQDRGHTKR
jgi:PilZ domain